MGPAETEQIDEIRRLAEASAWRVALFEADLEATEDFEAWLASHPRNADAWKQVAATWDRFDENATEPELIVARRDALERARRTRQRRFAGTGRRGAEVGIAASLLAVASLGALVGFGVWRSTRAEIYQTTLGERRTITLADGSQVDLDSNTRLAVKLRPKARALDLISGQARFEVAHDATRPFTVHARDKTVVATGTSFNVDMIGAKVIVTLFEGRVLILQDRPAHLPIIEPHPSPIVVARLTPGEQLIAQPSKLERPAGIPRTIVLEKVSTDRTMAWESGQLVFDNEPLSSVAERVARYGDRPIAVDGQAAALRLSGVFDAGDLNTFLDAVQRALPVAAETDADGVVHLRRRGI